MDENQLQQCQELIQNGQIDCQSDYLNECCFLDGGNGTGVSPLGNGEELFNTAFGKSGELFDSWGGIGILGAIAIAFAVAAFR